MSIFLKATKRKLRFQTNKGVLSTEQLWGLSLTDLDSLAVSYDEQLEKSATKSYLDRVSTTDTSLKLERDIVVAILTEKLKDQEAASKRAETKAHNAKIDALIAQKQDEKLANMSLEDLEKMRK